MDIKTRLLKNIKIDKIDKNECWNWTASCFSDGYGKIYFKGKRMGSHRASYEVFKRHIPYTRIVCHKCDNIKCINPDHLFLGSQSDNIKDKNNKGRNKSNIPFSLAKYVFKNKDKSPEFLAKETGLSIRHILRIHRGEAHSHREKLVCR